MKYIEELIPGNVFIFNNKHYILTSDYKKTGQKLSICLNDGFPKWISDQEIISEDQIYTLDKDNNIIAITNVNNSTENKDIHQIAAMAHNAGITKK